MEICPVSLDFPHVEVGSNRRNCLGASLADASPRAPHFFHADGVIDPAGEGLAADLRRPAPLGRPLGATP
jgi:hypothetical protein